MEEKELQHPEGKIQLFDGRILDCYPTDEWTSEVNNELQLDTTGVYLSLKKPHKADRAEDVKADDEKEVKKLFLDNAFVFLANRERILSDSRMFLCPVPIQSGLAYTGTSGFRRPTLGIYIEFWEACTASNIMEENGEKWLLWHIAGSPLSGMNRCTFVNEQGKTKSQYVSSFSETWSSFMNINTRYDEAKSKYDSYTLRQVVSILEDEGKKVEYKHSTHIFFVEQANKVLKKQLKSLKEYNNRIYEKYHQALLALKREELKAFIAEYNERDIVKTNRLVQIQQERLKLRKQLKANEISNKQYQKLWTPLRKEKEEIRFEMSRFVGNNLHSIFPNEVIQLSEVKDFLEKDAKEKNREAESEEPLMVQ